MYAGTDVLMESSSTFSRLSSSHKITREKRQAGHRDHIPRARYTGVLFLLDNWMASCTNASMAS